MLGQVGVQPLQRPQQLLLAEADGRHERDRIVRHRRRLETAIGDQRMQMHEQAQVTAEALLHDEHSRVQLAAAAQPLLPLALLPQRLHHPLGKAQRLLQRILAEQVSRERWILDGNFDDSLSLSLRRTQLVILLLVPRWLRVSRLLRRSLRQALGERRSLPLQVRDDAQGRPGVGRSGADWIHPQGAAMRHCRAVETHQGLLVPLGVERKSVLIMDDTRWALREGDRPAWDEYVRLEREGVRREAISVLAQLVSRLEAYSLPERVAFVEALVGAAREPSASSLPIRQPLFGRIVFPVLIDRYDRNEIGSARALLHFVHQIHGCLRRDAIGDRELYQVALLDRALVQEPGARDLQRRWLDVTREWLDYAIHEVPAGVLHGPNGATVADCEEMLEHVDTFESRADSVGIIDQDRESIARWRYYFGGYRKYLLEHGRYGSFARFLEDHPPPLELES